MMFRASISVRAIALMFLVLAGFAAAEGRRLEVLFLGDDRGHKPIERYRVLKAALGPRGYNLTFVEDLSQITRERLDRHDALIVYANHQQDEVPPAMLEWVRDGGGLVALHCAAGCFHPSEDWFDVVGGRFKSHEGHVFSPETVDAGHEITRELPKLEAWDETYEHQDLTDDRHLLQVRKPINKGETEPEPWTWTREEGKGRVFYTASGHDLRVWGQPAYQELVARALVWSVGPEVAKEFASLELASLELEVPEVENRAHPDIPMMPLQKPLSAKQSADHTQVPAGTELVLFASEPMVVNPIAIDWDERGRAWVVESLGYPNDVPTEPGTGEDRIKILEDTDGDGRADKVTVFADKLRHCTTTAFYRGGVIATDGHEIVFLRDENGDDRSDTRRVLASGLNMNDTHASTSHFLYGMDNWIHATVGYSGVDIRLGDRRHKFGSSAFRFRPDLSELELLQRTTNNTWGLGFTEDGTVLGSTANNNPSWQVSIPRRAYERSGLEQPKTPRLDEQPLMYCNTRDITQVDQLERYTAAAGHMLYHDEFFEGIVEPGAAFICEPTGHIVASGTIHDRGALHRIDLRGQNVFASADAWSAPVAARPGPDGAIWVADWYNPIIQHNVVFRFWNPERGYDQPHSPYHVGEKRPGKGNAYVTPLRDRKHGRIWRIVPKEGGLREVPKLSAKDPATLLRTLNSPSQHLRLHAQRLLIENGRPDLVGKLAELVRLAATPEGRDAPLGAYHALRTLQGLREAGIDGAREPIVAALEADHVGLRLQAVASLDPADPALLAALPGLWEKASAPRERLAVLTAAALAVPNDGLAEGLWKGLSARPPRDGTVVEAAKLALRRQGTTLLTVALAGGSLPGGWLDGELEEITRRVANGPNRAALEPIVAAANPALGDRFSRILKEAPVKRPAEEKLPAHLNAGRDAYMKACVECHQADGKGVENTFPPLEGSEWVSGDPRTLLRIMLGGLMGPITVKGVEYNSVMPGHSHASDDELAAIAGYVRHQFGGKREKAVDPKYVKELRPEVEARKYRPWTVKELSEAKGQ